MNQGEIKHADIQDGALTGVVVVGGGGLVVGTL